MHIDGPIGLGHTRLSIIDLESGAQPLSTRTAAIWVAFNGEIFNYVELREVLLRQGHRLSHAVRHRGSRPSVRRARRRLRRHLNGQFAIALWDGRRQRSCWRRDRVGIRPLFFTWNEGAWLRLRGQGAVRPAEVPRRFDAAALASTFSYWSTLPPASVFEGSRSCRPVTLMRRRRRRPCERYWDWRFPGSARHEASRRALRRRTARTAERRRAAAVARRRSGRRLPFRRPRLLDRHALTAQRMGERRCEPSR
jgi:asparagine synthase (glutamine-hydrolysing)